MKKAHQVLIIIAASIILFPCVPIAQTENEDFDFLLLLTQQDIEMNWWFSVPAQFRPKVSPISEVTKGEFFKILPIFNHYGTKSQNEVKITYDVEIINPDGNVDESMKNVTGFQGPAPGPYLLPSLGMLAVSFDPEDPYGEYTVNVSAYDHVKKQKAKKTRQVILKKFDINKLEGNLESWYFTYPTRPEPSLALTNFINSPRPYINDKGNPLWSTLWLYKQIYSENEFLVPHTVEFYKTKATRQQQKDIILLFHLLNKLKKLPLNSEFDGYIKKLKKLRVPNPYEEIETGDQLDMLWAEFFATSRVKPIRQILTALNLGTHVGTLEKVKSGELTKSPEIQKKATLEAVFQSALWSVMSNCKQSPLLFQYCMGLYESDQLNEMEKGCLGAMLRKVSEEKQKNSNQ